MHIEIIGKFFEAINRHKPDSYSSIMFTSNSKLRLNYVGLNNAKFMNLIKS